MMESGSTVAAFHDGITVATVYGTTVRKKSASTWYGSMCGTSWKRG